MVADSRCCRHRPRDADRCRSRRLAQDVGSRGIHIYVRIERRWTFSEVRRAALAFAREVERRAPDLATSKWWKEERHGVFLDYNQNAKDRTVAAAYSVRPKPDARVSAPLSWDEIEACEPGDFTLATMPDRFARSVTRTTRWISMPARSRRCSSSRHVTPARVSAMRPGLLITRSRPMSHRACNRRVAGYQPGRSSRSVAPKRKTMRSRDSSAGVRGIRKRRASAAADVLVDAMRGRFHTWTRIRINLQNVPAELRPPQEALDPNQEVGGWGRPRM